MARIRTIKPEFPQSESMGRVSRDSRLLFIQIWTLADDVGRLRGDSRMLASLLYPYDDGEEGRPKTTRTDIERWLIELQSEGCLLRYENDGSQYIQICNWLNHQKIDKPSPPRSPGSGDEGSRVLANPRERSSGDLDRDRGSGPRPGPGSTSAASRPTHSVEFSEFKTLYPKRGGGQPWSKALKAISARLRTGSTWSEILSGTRRYAEFIRATGKEGTEYVLQAATFCGPDERYRELWAPPAEKPNAMDEIMARAGRAPTATPRFDPTVIDHDDPFRISN